MKTNTTAASYHPRILSPKYGQTASLKPLTANRRLPFAVRWPDLVFKVSFTSLNSSPYIITFSIKVSLKLSQKCAHWCAKELVKFVSSHLLHLFDCNIIHISFDNAVRRTPKRSVINDINLSFFF